MRERLTNRLQELREEYRNGQRMLDDLDARREDLHQTLLRISGAIQVVEELLAPAEVAAPPAGATDAAASAPSIEAVAGVSA